MDDLKDKKYATYDYLSRYTGVPYYYNKRDNKEVYGISHNMLKNTSYVIHKVAPSDTLDKLALKYYNNPTYWWVIAYFNDIQDAFINLKSRYTTLKIPSISNITFGDLR